MKANLQNKKQETFDSEEEQLMNNDENIDLSLVQIEQPFILSLNEEYPFLVKMNKNGKQYQLHNYLQIFK